MNNKAKLLALVGVFSLSLAACSAGSETPSNGGSDKGSEPIEFVAKDPLTIGYSVYDLQNPYWQSYAAGVEAGAAEHDVKVLLSDQKSSQQEQVSGSLDLINQNISALIITPVQPSALPTTIDAAHNAKIPVVVADIGVAGNYDAYIQSNNREGGVLAAQTIIADLADAAAPRKVGVIELHAGSVVGEERVAGFKETIEAEEGFEIVASLDGNDTVDGGFTAAQDMLTANPDLAAIYAANDDSAIGASRALETFNLSVQDGFILIGFDGSDPALELIDQSVMSATVAQDPFGQGKKAVEVALNLLNGEDAGFSDAESRTVFFPVEMVTSENLVDFRSAREAQK